MINLYRTLLRLARIVNTLGRHGLFALADRYFLPRLIHWFHAISPANRRRWRSMPVGERIRHALEELGPTFVKFGQALSTRLDVIPEEIGLEIKKLQDDVAPFPFSDVERIVQEALEGPIEKFYVSFCTEPEASASIAQVHRALTLDGRMVAVKVMRPGIIELVASDIQMLRWFAAFIKENIPEWRRFHAQRVVEEFAETLHNEMDFQIEASRAQQFRKNFEHQKALYIPEIIWPLTTKRILTMEWVEGVPVSRVVQGQMPGVNPSQIAQNIATSFFHQVLRDGYFHADQHPGNIFVKQDGTLTLLDFGIVGQVSIQTRIFLAEMIQGFLMRDYYKVAQVHMDAGYIPPDTDIHEFEEACRQIGEPIFGRPLNQISFAHLLGEMFKVTERFQMEVQPQLLLLQKTMFTLEGLGRQLDPNMNMWMLGEPLIREWMKEHMGPRGKLRSARRELRMLIDGLGELPELIHTSLDRLAHDRVFLRIHPSSLERLERRISIGFHRQAAAVAGGTLFVGAAVMAAGGVSPWWFGPPLVLALLNFWQGMRAVR